MTEPTAPPASPPTPPIALTALLARADLGLRQLAGPAEVSIRWVHTSEMADPYPYLLGGELLMTAGVQLADPERYVSRVVEAGAAALGFGVAPVYDAVPAALVEACARHGLPLLEVPPQTTFSGVARAVWLLMARAREDELRRVSEAQRALATAASRPAPVGAVLRVLAGRLGGWAALVTPAGSVLDAAGAEPRGAVLEGARGLVRVVAPSADRPHPAPSRCDTLRLRRVAPADEDADSARQTRGSAPDPAAQSPQGLDVPPDPESAVHGGSPGAESTPPSDSLGTLASSAPPAFEERGSGGSAPSAPTGPQPSHLPPEGLGKGRGGENPPKATALTATDTVGDTHLAAYALAGPHALAVATPHRAPGDHTIAGVAAVLLTLLTAERQGADEAARSAALVRLLLGGTPEEAEPLLGEGPWVVVHARGQGAPPDLGTPLADAAEQHVRALVPADREVTPHPGWTLGVSAPAGLEGLAVADTQAARALERAEATRTPLARHRPAGFGALINPEEAAAYAHHLLAPLSDPLRTTLRAWLSLHGSWDRSAVALGVHRNTVRQRIGRAAALLGVDLDDMDVRTELWLALRSAESHSGHRE
ncbi:PucR family transcriptional regulator ligand-binding domain-containing protein [Streptomyces violascens]|uniref:PucR family transcriptional regulator ligand-binding domain-containing protein n=1 Tax=Streptomyces violascens TaxID=67381 RepID=UPI00365C6127